MMREVDGNITLKDPNVFDSQLIDIYREFKTEFDEVINNFAEKENYKKLDDKDYKNEKTILEVYFLDTEEQNKVFEHHQNIVGEHAKKQNINVLFG